MTYLHLAMTVASHGKRRTPLKCCLRHGRPLLTPYHDSKIPFQTSSCRLSGICGHISLLAHPRVVGSDSCNHTAQSAHSLAAFMCMYSICSTPNIETLMYLHYLGRRDIELCPGISQYMNFTKSWYHPCTSLISAFTFSLIHVTEHLPAERYTLHLKSFCSIRL